MTNAHEVQRFFSDYGDTTVRLNYDLMKINIEGSEYTLLDRMIKSGIIEIVDNLQIQFHKEHENEITRDYIQSHLKNTHNLTYNYTYVWENWKLK